MVHQMALWLIHFKIYEASMYPEVAELYFVLSSFATSIYANIFIGVNLLNPL